MPFDDLITRVGERLDQLEPKPTSPQALRELLTRLDDKIRAAQEKGYGPAEIVDLIVGCGLEINPNELKKQLADTLETKGRKRSTKRGKLRAKKNALDTNE